MREVRDNLKRLEHRNQDSVDLKKLIASLSNQSITEAIEDNYNFEKIKKGEIKSTVLRHERLVKYVGWNCEKLLESIDGKITEIKELPGIYQKFPNEAINLTARMNNLYYQLLALALFIRHKD